MAESKVNYNEILDYILSETIKRKNKHKNVESAIGSYLATRIVASKEIEEKFKIEEFEVDIMYFELTNNSYINAHTGNVTIKGIEFSESGGFTEKKKRETISKNAQVIQSWALVLLTLGLLLSEAWKIFHHLTYE